MAPDPYRLTRHFTRATPRCQAPRHPAVQHPCHLWATNPAIPPWCAGSTLTGTAPELSRKPKTENRSELQLFCDCGLSKSPQSPIEARKCSRNNSFMLCRDREGSAIAKKLQKSRDFCFRNELVAEAEAELLKRLNAEAGKISRWGESRERRAKPAAEREVAGDATTQDKGRFQQSLQHRIFPK